MKVVNIHERVLDGSVAKVGRLVDSLGSTNDLLWPIDRWVPMKFDGPLGVGAVGGHGPSGTPLNPMCRAIASNFVLPNRRVFSARIVLRSNRPMEERPDSGTLSRCKSLDGPFSLGSIIRPLHDALMEDALDHAEASLGKQMPRRKWSCWVKVVRWIIRRRRQK